MVAAARRVVGCNRGGSGTDRLPRGAVERLALHGATELFVAEVLEWAEEAGIGAERAPSIDPRLGRVLADLEAGVRAGPLPFGRWRDQTGLGRVQLERIARRELGTSLRARRDERLLAAIRTSLARGGESLKETAARLGFFDSAHFTRWVRRHAGCPPRELRGRFL